MSLTFDNLSLGMTESLADGASRGGHYKVASQLYRLAVRDSNGKRADLRVKEGLAASPTVVTATNFQMMDVLAGFQGSAFVSDGLATWRKILPFYEDPRFIELADKHRGLLPIPNWHWNLQTALWAVQHSRCIEGDFVELGVFKGHTTLFCAEYVDFGGWDKTWHLFDTFSGIPDDQLDAGWEDMNKSTYGGTFSYDEVRARFAHIPNIRVVQGRVPEILAGHAPDKIAFMHLDLNNTTAEIAALDHLVDRISRGGILLLDDFCWEVARAQHAAERQWFESRGWFVLPLPTGQGLFVKT